MRCPRQERIEQLAAGSDDPALPRIRAHVDECQRCRDLLEQAKADASLIGDIRELTQRREEVKPLLHGLSENGGSDAAE